MKSTIVILNGSIRGEKGNSALLANRASLMLSKKFGIKSEIIHLSQPPKKISSLAKKLEKCAGILVVSGTYWNNVGSPLQRFFEVFTQFEQTKVFFGKPAAALLTMDSVGGLEVASKIHATFNGLGCWTPPCATVLISRVGLEAVERSKKEKHDPNEDVWRLQDIEVLLHNLVYATSLKLAEWQSWPHAAFKLKQDLWPSTGDLEMGAEVFLK